MKGREDVIQRAAKLWSKLEEHRIAHFFGSFHEYLNRVLEWERREIPEKDRKEMAKDIQEALDYLFAVFRGKEKFNEAKMDEIFNRIKKWKPENYPLKKEIAGEEYL